MSVSTNTFSPPTAFSSYYDTTTASTTPFYQKALLMRPQPPTPPRRTGYDFLSAASSGSGHGSGHGGGNSAAVNALALLSFMYFLKLIQVSKQQSQTKVTTSDQHDALASKNQMMMTTATATVTGTTTGAATAGGVVRGLNYNSAEFEEYDIDRTLDSIDLNDYSWTGAARFENRTKRSTDSNETRSSTVSEPKKLSYGLSRNGSQWLKEFQKFMPSVLNEKKEPSTSDRNDTFLPQIGALLLESTSQLMPLISSFMFATERHTKNSCSELAACQLSRKIKQIMGNTPAIVADIIMNLVLPSSSEKESTWCDTLLIAIAKGRENNQNCELLYPHCKPSPVSSSENEVLEAS